MTQNMGARYTCKPQFSIQIMV